MAKALMPVLKNNDNLAELMFKLPLEVHELSIELTVYQVTGRIPDRDKAAKEALDVMQLAIGILDILDKRGADVPDLMRGHQLKLASRGWQFERWIPIDWRNDCEKP